MDRRRATVHFYVSAGLLLSGGLLRLELDLLEDAGFLRQFSRAGRGFVDAENERQNVRVLLSAETSRRVLRHRDPDPFEEIADGQPVPARDEFAAGQSRRHFTAGQLAPVARRARVAVERLAARRLFLRVDAVPDRLGRRLRV